MENIAIDHKLELQYQDDQQQNQVLMNSYRSSQFMLHQAPNLKPRKNRLKDKTNGGLKKVIKDQKIKRLVDNFCKKLLKNNTNRQPANYDLLNSGQKQQTSKGLIKFILQTLRNTQGFSVSNTSLTVWSFINIMQISIMVFILSIIMTFPETSQQIAFVTFRIISGFIYISDMILNFITSKQQFGKSYATLDQICLYYLRHGFIIDLLSLTMLLIDLLVPLNLAILNVMLLIIKLLNNIQKFQKYEYLYIRTKQRAMYFRLIKVFLTNFAIAHILAIILNQMTVFSEQNWYQKLNIVNEDWYVKYIWGYYWGTNIMLTVGFGDIAAANVYEAAALIFIETVSCITLAYNISTVGALIAELKSTSDLKSNKIKVFHTMCKENQISPQLQTKVNHFIQQSFQIKQSFQFDDYDRVLESLPKNMQSQYRKEANKILFDNLGFLNNFSKKTLICLAQTVNRKIAHPQEIIKKRGQFHDFCILQNGKVQYVCRLGKSMLNGLPIQTLQVKKKQKPKALSLGFIQRKVLTYDIQSDRYSILYYLNRQDFIRGISTCDMDYQLFCTLKDKDAYYQDENQLYECDLCSRKSYHSKFDCSKLHYIPLKQNIIANQLASVKKLKQSRQYTPRQETKVQSLKIYRQANEDYVKFIQTYYGRNFLNSIWAVKQLHSQIQQMKHQDTFNTQLSNNLSLYEATNNFTKLQRLIMETRNNYNQFWDLQTDEIKNYRYYFSEYNAENYIKEKYSKGAVGNNIKFMALF